MIREILETLKEGVVKQSFGGYNFSWDGEVITMSKDGKEISKKEAPSLSSAKMKMMIKDTNEEL